MTFGSSAAARMGSDCGYSRMASCSGPRTTHATTWTAMKFMMRLLSTICTPRKCSIKAGMRDQSAPPTIDATSVTTIASGPGTAACPAQQASTAPSRNCPSTPILNISARNAMTTASAVTSSGIVCTRVLLMLYCVPMAPWSNACATAAGDAPAIITMPAHVPAAINIHNKLMPSESAEFRIMRPHLP